MPNFLPASVTSLFQSAGQIVPTTPFTEKSAIETFSIGSVVLHGFEATDLLRVVGNHKSTVQEFVGGSRSVQTFGYQPGPISWQGCLVPRSGFYNQQADQHFSPVFDPIARTQELHLIMVKGEAVPFIFGQLEWLVVVTSFDFDVRNRNEVEYSIELTVVEQRNLANVKNTSQPSLDVTVGLLELTDHTLKIIALLEQSEIFLILSAQLVDAIKNGEDSLIALAALIETDALSTQLGFGIGLFSKANQLNHIAALVRNFAGKAGL